MAGITSTKSLATECAGYYKLVIITCTPTTASDVIDITEATHGIAAVDAVIPVLTAGYDPALARVYATSSTNRITVITSSATGAAATEWTGAGVQLWVIGH